MTDERAFEEFLGQIYDVQKLNVTTLKPRHLIKELKKIYFGQDDAAEIVATAVAFHYQRAERGLTLDSGDPVTGNHILMAGPTGSGKTYLMQLIAEIIDVPFYQTDITAYTSAGYIGDNLENIVGRLITAAGGDIERAQRGIIYVDEIDKIARSSSLSGKDVNGEAVQQGLLKYLDGKPLTIKIGEGSTAEEIEFDTSNVLFVLSGAFSGMEEIMRGKQQTALGFGTEPVTKGSFLFDYDMIQVEDFVRYGMLPELLGRCPIYVPLKAHTEESLTRILTEGRDSIVKRTAAELKLNYGITLNFKQDALQHIVQRALQMKTGGRGLNMIESTLLRYKARLPSTNLTKYDIAASHITGPKKHLDELDVLVEAYEKQEEKKILSPKNTNVLLERFTVEFDNNKPEEYGFALDAKVKVDGDVVDVIYEHRPAKQFARLCFDVHTLGKTVCVACPDDNKYSTNDKLLVDFMNNAFLPAAESLITARKRDRILKELRIEDVVTTFQSYAQAYNTPTIASE